MTRRLLAFVLLLAAATVRAQLGDPVVDPIATLMAAWTARFTAEVDRRLEVPADDQQRYLALMQQALSAAGRPTTTPQAVVVVDRSPQVQALFVVLRTPAGGWHWIGAAPVSTGLPGRFDHFRTPTGVFAHTPDNPDFRAEGTLNENHIRGYGRRGLRVFDFGWVMAERGWGGGGTSPMRLQMHATDPDVLERRLGSAASKGCIRIPATLDVFLDRHGVLDAEYEATLARGESLWVMRADRQPIPWPGRELVILDSQAKERPAWSPRPGAARPIATACARLSDPSHTGSAPRTMAPAAAGAEAWVVTNPRSPR
jgi:hypothetical protein